MTNFIPYVTSPHDSTPAMALRFGRPLSGLLVDAIAFACPMAPAWAVATEGGE